jgi:hypothetical protein
MNNNNLPTSSGIGFMGALQVLLIGLKLGSVIDWSWWKVFLPLEVDAAAAVVIIGGLVVASSFKRRRFD